jgi:hypothetical protein
MSKYTKKRVHTDTIESLTEDEKASLSRVIEDVRLDLTPQDDYDEPIGYLNPVTDKKIISKIEHLLLQSEGAYYLNVPKIKSWALAVVSQHEIFFDKHCSFSLGKETIHIKVMHPDGSLLNPEAIKHVFIHEVCHCICPTNGHGDEFWCLLTALPKYKEAPPRGYICKIHQQDSNLVRPATIDSSVAWICARGVCVLKNDEQHKKPQSNEETNNVQKLSRR